MLKLIPLKEIESSTEEIVGIVIGFLNSSDKAQLHSGILYREEDNTFKVLHLNWHNRLFSDSISSIRGTGYVLVQNNIPVEFLRQINAKCIRIRSTRPQIAYSVCYEGGYFDENIVLKLNGLHGLTCASFVLAVLKSLGLELIDRENWKLRCGDRKWQKHILYELQCLQLEHPERISVEDIEMVKKDIRKKCYRFRPQDVAAGSTSEYFPASFKYCNKEGKKLKQQMLTRVDK